MRIAVGLVLLLIVALSPLGRALAQDQEISTDVLLAAERPVKIFFPGKISEIVGDHPSIGIRPVEHGTVQLSVLTPEFDDTHVTIVLTDGRRFAFAIKYSGDIREEAGAYSSTKSNTKRKESVARSRSEKSIQKASTRESVD